MNHPRNDQAACCSCFDDLNNRLALQISFAFFVSVLVLLIGFVQGFALAAAPISTANSSVEDSRWAQWRGNQWDSVSAETNLPADLNQEGVHRWQVDLPGPGGSSPIVWEDRVFLTAIDGDQPGDSMFLMCFRTDGTLDWKRQLDGENMNYRDSANSASPSPMTDGNHVWAQMTNGILHCFTVDGDPVWKKDLQEAYGRFNIQFGMSSTPLLHEGRIFIQLIHGDMRDQRQTSEGQVIALDANTGEEIWHHQRLTDGYAENLHAYTSPTIYRDQDRSFLVIHGADYVTGHSLDDGTEIWRMGGMNIKGPDYNPYLRFVSSPTAVPGMIVVPTAKRGPVLALRPDRTGELSEEALLWKMDVGTPDVASPLIYEGYVYLADERGVVVCLDAATGEVKYQQRLMASNHRSTPVAADGKIYVTSRDGDVFVLRAGPRFEVLSQKSLNQETTASPAIAGGLIFIRTFEALHAFGQPQ